MNNFVTYEKDVQSVVTRIRHIVRIKLNSAPSDIIKVLSNVPDNAKVSMIVDDLNLGAAEITFDEERISN